MATPEATADSFRSLDFHDDTLMGISVLPSQHRREGAKSVVEIQLRNDDETRFIRFCGCANLRVAMDFDVLADNCTSNTSRVDAHTDLNRMRGLMESQQADWDVNYTRGTSSPLDWKLATMEDLAFFRVQFFGGAVDVIAREYQVVIAPETAQGG